MTLPSAASKNRFLHAEYGDLGPDAKREIRWLTPPHVVAALGAFDLDPCGAPDHVLATRTYLPENGEDGLSLPWEGRVWLNPPYGSRAKPFMDRMAQHGNGVALTFARTETKLFFDTVWPVATAVLFLKGRLTFLRGDGVKAIANSGAPSCLIAYSDDDMLALHDSGLPGRLVLL